MGKGGLSGVTKEKEGEEDEVQVTGTRTRLRSKQTRLADEKKNMDSQPSEKMLNMVPRCKPKSGQRWDP
jgi:hypothetical protein